MNIIFDSDATIVDFQGFINGDAFPYFKKKYNMVVRYPEKLEIEDVLGIEATLISNGMDVNEAKKATSKMVSRYWICGGYLNYTIHGKFFPHVKTLIRILRKSGHKIQIHTSRGKSCDKDIGEIVRGMTVLQYWLNGCFLKPKDFVFYPNDKAKVEGIVLCNPAVVFEDKLGIIEALTEKDIKCMCISGTHNQSMAEGKNVVRLYSYDVVEKGFKKLLGQKKYDFYLREAQSDRCYKKILKLVRMTKVWFRPIVLNKHRLVKAMDKGIIYVSNHRSTMDPLVTLSVVNESIHYAALARFFAGQDSIFNNSKNIFLCKFTAKLFHKLDFSQLKERRTSRKLIMEKQ